MFNSHGIFGFSNIPYFIEGKTRSISAENPRGEKGGGGKAKSSLGVGRKGNPAIFLNEGDLVTLVDIEGPGMLQHFFITMPFYTTEGHYALRDTILRFYWDDEKQPSVEVPIGDFFCNGFGAYSPVNSLPIVVNPTGGMNCYFPMPFRKRAVVTVESQHRGELMFFYQFNYTLVNELPDNTLYFHAQWRRNTKGERGKDYTILDGVKGKGKYVGTYLAWACLGRYWWGEGEIKFYLDGDEQWPTICGTGTEDYFGGAWGFADVINGVRVVSTYNTPFLGYPYYSTQDTSMPDYKSPDSIPMHGLYRWHLMDPIIFNSDLKVDIQQIGSDGKRLYERNDDISSVAYWYQCEPHAEFPLLLKREERWPL